MSEPSDEFRAVLAHPGDLARRLAYASVLDARHDPLGEFIRLECQLDQSPHDDEGNLRLWDRRLALLEAHGESWLPHPAGEAEFRLGRGLVESARLDLDTYLERGAELFARHPIRSLSIRGAHGRMGELLASPWIDRIEHLSLPGPSWDQKQSGDEGLSDDDVAELAASDRFAELRSIDLGYNEHLGPQSVNSILNSPWCGQLESLGLGWTAAGDEGAALIAATDRFEILKRLDISKSGLGPDGARLLADSPTLAYLGLTEFNFSFNDNIDQAGNARLLRSPVLARVGSVQLEGDINDELIDAFVQSDSLGAVRALSFADYGAIDTALLRRLSQWPGLSRLEHLMFVLIGLSDEQLGILSASPWLADLKTLSLSETWVTDEGVERLCRSPAWRGLVELGIDRNGLTERSVRAILGASWFPRLTMLNLHASESIGDAGAAVLASYKGTTRLRRLILSMAGIGDAGAWALAGARYAPELWTLWLLGNPAISPATIDHLKRRLGRRVRTERSEVPEAWRNQPQWRV